MLTKYLGEIYNETTEYLDQLLQEGLILRNDLSGLIYPMKDETINNLTPDELNSVLQRLENALKDLEELTPQLEAERVRVQKHIEDEKLPEDLQTDILAERIRQIDNELKQLKPLQLSKRAQLKSEQKRLSATVYSMLENPSYRSAVGRKTDNAFAVSDMYQELERRDLRIAIIRLKSSIRKVREKLGLK